MTLTEKELLTRFLEQLASARAEPKDREAEALIREAVARQPDAAYLLVQRTMQLEHLLAASQAEVQKLQQTAQAPSASGGFLGDPNAWGRSTGTRPAQPAAADAGAPQAALNARPAAPGGSWGSGLFGNIATTAAGVVAGSFLFQGIQGLLNRDGGADASKQAAAQPETTAAAEPELLNSYDTPEHLGGDSLADLGGDSGDFS